MKEGGSALGLLGRQIWVVMRSARLIQQTDQTKLHLLSPQLILPLGMTRVWFFLSSVSSWQAISKTEISHSMKNSIVWIYKETSCTGTRPGKVVSAPSFAPSAPSLELLQVFLLRTEHLWEVSAHILKACSHIEGLPASPPDLQILNQDNPSGLMWTGSSTWVVGFIPNE